MPLLPKIAEIEKPKAFTADYADERRWGNAKTLPRMNTDETDGNREIGTSRDREIGKAKPAAADYADKRRSETRLPELPRLPKIAEIENHKPKVESATLGNPHFANRSDTREIASRKRK